MLWSNRNIIDSPRRKRLLKKQKQLKMLCDTNFQLYQKRERRYLRHLRQNLRRNKTLGKGLLHASDSSKKNQQRMVFNLKISLTNTRLVLITDIVNVSLKSRSKKQGRVILLGGVKLLETHGFSRIWKWFWLTPYLYYSLI